MFKDLEAILSDGEGYTVEFKISPDKTISQEVCAFANASGGRIFIGVNDAGEIVGTDIIDFFQSEGQIRYDSITHTDLSIDDNFNEMAYKDFLRSGSISNVLPRYDILKNLGCIEIVDGKAVYTNAGALFFRNNSEDMIYQHATVVCGLYKGVDKAYILDAKEFSGSMVNNIDEAVLFLKRNLKLSYEIKEVKRTNILEIPEDALREAVVNAVCHRNYFEKGARVMVEIFDDRVEITNPGGLPKGITSANFGTLSITRNPVIASLLHRIHYIERMGTGISRIINAMKNAGLEEPIFQFDGFFKVTFKRDINVGKDVGKDFVNGAKYMGKENEITEYIVSEIVTKTYTVLKENNNITIPELSKSLNVSQRQVQRIIKKLRDKKLIERKGGRKQGYWDVKE